MTRVVGEPVEVRVQARCPGAEPVQFLWRGRLYLVRSVLAHWVEARAWWRLSEPTGLPSAGAEREIWRVEAGHGREASLGVYDLAYDPTTHPTTQPVAAGRWTLTRTHD